MSKNPSNINLVIQLSQTYISLLGSEHYLVAELAQLVRASDFYFFGVEVPYLTNPKVAGSSPAFGDFFFFFFLSLCAFVVPCHPDRDR